MVQLGEIYRGGEGYMVLADEIILKEATIADAVLFENYQLKETPYTVKPMTAMTDSLHETKKFPVLILKEETLVGFFILQKEKGFSTYPTEENALLLHAHSIDERFQNKGYGKLSMERLPLFIKENFDSIDEIVLAVDYDNLSGQMLYLKTGFVDTKKRSKEDGAYKFIYSKKI
ncbi:MAG: GNAT family N-acetyltransferase [Carnobacterium sp.]|uniref:GNAT family N-acetyltransferase n=1 Tax=Carnobacterium sp. TaxID=48221 RepID=UPI002FC75046